MNLAFDSYTYLMIFKFILRTGNVQFDREFHGSQPLVTTLSSTALQDLSNFSWICILMEKNTCPRRDAATE
jgi:hypothetical protein